MSKQNKRIRDTLSNAQRIHTIMESQGAGDTFIGSIAVACFQSRLTKKEIKILLAALGEGCIDYASTYNIVLPADLQPEKIRQVFLEWASHFGYTNGASSIGAEYVSYWFEKHGGAESHMTRIWNAAFRRLNGDKPLPKVQL